MGTGFRKKSCLSKRIEWDDDSNKRHAALVANEASLRLPPIDQAFGTHSRGWPTGAAAYKGATHVLVGCRQDS